MRALQLQRYDGPTALQAVELDDLEPDGETVLIDVQAIGINYPDLLITTGKYQLKPELPFVPGSEVSGTIAWAPGGSGWSEGDRVAAFVWNGGYAERVRAPLNAVLRLPDAMDFRTGAATIINYHTVHFALSRRGRLTAGETVLVLGAAGGIGSAAVQVGKGLGARVVAGVASEEQAAAAREAGADDVVVLTDGFSAQVRELTGGGVDVVLDPLGDWLFGEALRAIVPEGRILVVGFAAGAIPQLGVNRLLLKNVDAVGVAWGAFLSLDPELMARAGRDIATMHERGAIRPLISASFDFDHIPEALETLAAGRIHGKAVVELSPRP